MPMAFSLKLAVVSATVFSTAVMLKLLAPFIFSFATSDDLPAIWTSLTSWLKPPYLYLLINCIIITIVASSRLQSNLQDSSSFSTYHEPVHDGLLMEVQPLKNAAVGYQTSQKFVKSPSESNFCTTSQFIDELRDEDMKITTKLGYKEITKNSDNKSVISVPTWTPPKISQAADLSISTKKPPASARFSHRKPTKTTTEGGRTLGVAKPNRQHTLESTWKTITEGRSVPLTRHLRKSDTWETHGKGHHNRNSEELSMDERITKSDTFDVNRGGGSRSMRAPPAPPSKLSRSGGSGRLRKEPSLGQEELNKRVEAFIKKFNEDMRLQRQESLNQYMEMINRGAH